MKLPPLLSILSLFPTVYRTVSAELAAARASSSDGGAKVTAAEVEAIAAYVGLKLAEGLTPLVLQANGL